MFRATILFFLFALVAYFFGEKGVGGLSMEIGRTLLFVFLVLSFLSLLYAIVRGKDPNVKF